MLESSHVHYQEWQAERPPYNQTGDNTREAPATLEKDALLPECELFQATFIEFDEIEICPDVFSPFAAGFFKKVEEARLLCRCVRMPRDHGFVPFLDRLRIVLNGVFVHPLKNGVIVIEPMGSFFECIRIDLQEGEQMLIETDGLVVVTVQ
jgi:hypothetical protein